MQIVKALLRGDTVDFTGRYYTIDGLSPVSVPDNPPRLLSGAGGRKMLSFALARQT